MKRIVELDILRAMAILFVVLGHALVGSEVNLFLRGCIYSFHMPLMFIVSGFVAAMTFAARPEAGRKILGSAKRLLVPYAACGLLVIPVVNYLLTNQVEQAFVPTWKNAFLYNRFLWYLPCCFFLVCCLVLGRKPWQWVAILVGLGAVYAAFPQIDYIRSVLSYAFPFFTGVWFFHHQEWMLRPSGRTALIALAILIPLACMFALLDEHTVAAHVLRSFGGLVVLPPLAYLAVRLARVRVASGLFEILGRNTLFIYCFDFCASRIAVQYFHPSNVWMALGIGFGIVIMANFIAVAWDEYIRDALVDGV